MAFDYVEKEMNDPASKKIDLDRYGVWVKKPPRNAEDTSNDQSNDTAGEIAQEETLDAVLPEIEEIELDTTSLENSPIDDLETIAQEATSGLSSLVEFEEQPIEDFFADDEDLGAGQDLDHGEIPVETFVDADFLDDFSAGTMDERTGTEEETTQGPTTGIGTEETTEGPVLQDEITLASDCMEEDRYGEDGTTGEEASADGFLGDDGEISVDEFPGETGEISLDEFMDASSTEKNDILDETPMEMDLTFDDEYAVETAADPVSQVEDSLSGEEIFDFDEMFGNIADESQPQETKEEETVGTPVEKTEAPGFTFDEVNEFDDFLSEFTEPKSTSKAYEPPKDFDLTVTVDGEGSMGPKVTGIADSEEENEKITLVSEEEKNSKNEDSSIDRLPFSDYTDESYGSDDFDIDKIMSEVEDVGEKTEGIQEGVAQDSPEAPTDNPESEEHGMEKPEEAMEFNQNEPSEVSRTEELINSIAGEIALLRNEISSLRHEFEIFKIGKASPDGNSALEQKPQEETSSGGFFADNNDDDTIALSGDELSNIFNTADFTEESVDVDTQQADEDSDNGLPSMDFDSEDLEEPVIEDNYFEDEDADGFPEEIDVPTGIVAQEDRFLEEIFEETETAEVDFPEDNYELSEQIDDFSQDEIVEPFEEVTEETVDDDFVEPAFDSSDDILEEEVVDAVEEEVPEVDETAEDSAEPVAEEVPEVDETAEEFTGPVAEEVPEVDETAEEFAEPVAEEVPEVDETAEEFTEPVAEEVPEVDETAEEFAEPVAEEVPEVGETAEEFVEPVQEEVPEVEETAEDSAEPVAEEIPEVGETAEDSAEPVAEEIPEVGETAEEFVESAQEEAAGSVETEEEISDEPVESVFESNQWEAPVIDDTMGFVDTAAEEVPEVDETAEEFTGPVAEEVPEVDETAEEVIESAQEEAAGSVETEEEISDEPVESVFESNQWEAPVIDDTMGFVDTAAEEVGDGGIFADDPLIIEEPVDTITSAEEELLEELEVIPVVDDELPGPETPAEESASEEPVGDTAVDSVEEVLAAEPVEEVVGAEPAGEVVKEESKINDIPDDLKQDIRSVLSYMDQLLDSLPEDKIAEFARSEHFELYKKLFTELGL